MRDRALHDALREFALEVAAHLSGEIERGAELEFEVVEVGERPRDRRRAGRPALYRYRPLTASFIGQRWPAVQALDSYARAARAVGPAAPAYLRHRGSARADADAALRDLVERLFDDLTSFALPDERFERLYAEVDATLATTVVTATVVAPLHGVRIASGRVSLADGLALVRRASIDSPPEALEGSARAAEVTAEADDGAAAAGEATPSPLDVFCVLERELSADAPLPVDRARAAFRRTLTALRLCGAGGTALGPLAWARAGAGTWHPVALGISARTRPELWELRHADETELRDMLAVLAASRHDETTGWALRRFEMGCERELESEALTDYLLALRALLAGPEASEAAVANRLSALCAPATERADLRRRVGLAFALERELVRGPAAGGTLALDSPRASVHEVEAHLRALLRDVLCGYLGEDLRAAADELAAVPAAPPDEPGEEIAVHDTRAPAVHEQPTEELEAIDSPAAPTPVGVAVTPSIDWEG